MKTEITPEQKSRRALIKERQQHSLFWQVVHLLGSLQLALILLATIALACAIATFTESRYDTQTAHAAIYKAPWFMAWLTVLCINLFAVTLTRWPWEKKHAGFIITHYGIILLLLGAMIGMTWGFEGNVTLHRGSPLTKITTQKSILQIESPADSYLYLLPYNVEVTRPSSDHPNKLSIPGTELQLVIDDWSNHLEQRPLLQTSDDPQAPAAVLLRLQSKMLHQEQIVPLTLRDTASATFDFFGLATLQLLPTLSKPHSTIEHESQVIGAHFAPVIVTQNQPSGIKLTLSDDGNLVTVMAPEGTSASYSRSDLMHQKLTIGAATIITQEYWPDFKIINGKPTNISQHPNNPALRVEIIFSSTSIEQPTPKKTPWLRLALEPDFKGIQYQLGRGSSIQKSGTLAMKASMPLGWSDWDFTLLDGGPHEEIIDTITPTPKTADSKSNRSSAPPGFHAYLIDREHQKGPSQWVVSGSVASLNLEQQMVRVAYGLELKPVPFSIELLHFEVPRDEGTETPSDFRATVCFKDLKTEAPTNKLWRLFSKFADANGEQKASGAQHPSFQKAYEDASTRATQPSATPVEFGVQSIHMNHPASFPGTFLANMTGINYKFSQAQWNPRDLDETTLQVLYDPGWLLKWIGSLAICIGIAMMFYFGKKK